MKIKLFLALFLLSCLSLPAFQIYSNRVICTDDNMDMTATGRTRILSNGKTAREYRCAMGHTAWVVDAY